MSRALRLLMRWEETTMTYRVHFSGMIAFVPEVITPGRAGARKVKKMRLLFLDGRPPHQAKDGEELVPHFAFVRFRIADLAPDSPRRPDLIGNNGYGVCFLNNEELMLDPTADNALDATLTPLTKEAYNGGALPPIGDLTWIMPLDKTLAEEHERYVRGELLKPDYVPHENRLLTARTQLKSGSLRTSDLRRATIAGQRLTATCRFGLPEQDPYKPGSRTHCEQPIATRITWQPALADDQPLVLSSKRFAMDELLPDLVFQDTKTTGRSIEIDIWNATFSELLDRLRGASDQHSWYTPTDNRSFRSLYRALELKDEDALPVFERDLRKPAKVQAYGDEGKNPGCPCGMAYISPEHVAGDDTGAVSQASVSATGARATKIARSKRAK